MPRSLIDGKAWISHEVARLKPTTLLDVGPGQGTYSDLLRGVTPGATWSCVEIFAPYVEIFELRRKYDVVHVADIRSFSWPCQYDVVILGDVLEHLTLADARQVWGSARAHARHVVLSIPIVEYPQGVHYDNIHETHLHIWSHELVVNELDGICRWQRHELIGVYLAQGSCWQESGARPNLPAPVPEVVSPKRERGRLT
jgi:hypothetical protein